jgi:hypothetical protein
MTTVIVARGDEEMADAHTGRLNHKKAQTPRFFQIFRPQLPIPIPSQKWIGYFELSSSSRTAQAKRKLKSRKTAKPIEARMQLVKCPMFFMKVIYSGGAIIRSLIQQKQIPAKIEEKIILISFSFLSFVG